jgi:hypothetical protein
MQLILERNKVPESFMKKGTFVSQELLKKARWNLLHEKGKPKENGNTNSPKMPAKRLPI